MQQTIEKWVKNKIQYHTTDMSGVKPECRFSSRENAFYLNSCAGLIRFTSRDLTEFTNFRSIFVNRFSQVETKKEFFDLYRDIIKYKWSRRARVKYTANIRTKLKMRLSLAS